VSEDESTAELPIGPEEELRVLTSILATLQKLDPQSRDKVLDTVTTYFGRDRGGHRVGGQGRTFVSEDSSTGVFSEDRTVTPKQFITEKQPKTDVERVACLAYYLTHYRDTPHFKTLDISKLNTEAAQVKFSNPTVAVDNATKANYLVPATKGNKQLGALGEQFVLALPDRDKARNVMSQARPRRRARKQPKDSEGLVEGEPDNAKES
jgi:hypothetical protein